MTDKSALEMAFGVEVEMFCEYWHDLYIRNANNIDDLIQLRWMLHGLHQFGTIDYKAMQDVHLLGNIASDRLNAITQRMMEAA